MPKRNIKNLTAKYHDLSLRIKDKRSKKVIFLAHCILNENTRYLGGACSGGCVPEILTQCIESDFGIVQMPCPEQKAWGGVMKRMLLTVYGSRGAIVYFCRHIILPLFIIYTKLIYGRLARQIARQIQDYLNTGFCVIGIVGIDGSPSCGVSRTLDFRNSFEVLANINIDSVTLEDANKVVMECRVKGKGFFIDALQKNLTRKNIDIRFWGHDLVAEIQGRASNLIF